MQLRIVSKEEAHRIVESLPGDCIMLLTFNRDIGISDCGRRIKKRKGQKLVENAKTIVFSNGDFVSTLNLHESHFTEVSQKKKENSIVRAILMPKLE